MRGVYLNRRLAFAALFGATLCLNLHAQSSPDYSNVNDILSGRRTLLEVDDIVVGNFVGFGSDSNLPPANYHLSNVQLSPNNALASANFFDRPHATLVTAAGSTVTAIDPVANGAQQSVHVTDSPNNSTEFNYAKAAVGDFNGDGFQDVAIASTNGLRIATAVNPANPAAGIRLGPTGQLYYNDTNYLAIAVGDFDGDGKPEIAVADYATLAIYRVNPTTLLPDRVAFIFLPIADQIPQLSITAGKFGTTNHEQLLVAGSSKGSITLLAYDFNSSLQPQVQDSQQIPGPFSLFLVQSGQFDPTSLYKQVAVQENVSGGDSTIRFITFDPSLKMTIQSPIDLEFGSSCSAAITVGNFGQTGQNLQIALPSTCVLGVYSLFIFGVAPVPGTLNFSIDVNNFGAGGPQDGDPAYFGLPAVAIDIQGRSLVLGDPTKVVLNATTQPTSIIATPPMHIDFSPLAGEPNSPPTLINVTAIPKGFFTEYDTDQKQTNQSTQKNTNSWSYGAKENIGASVGFGIPNLASVSVSDSFTAAQSWKGITEQEHGVSASSSFDVSAKTNFSDQVWFIQSRFNVYVYPVLNRLVCPASQPANCPDTAKVPLTIHFSAPDQVTFNTMSGNSLEWYQPVWEPGNVLSYPGSYSQLQKIVPNLQKLSNDLTWSTDQNSLVERSTWSQGSSTSQSTSYNQTYSFDNKTSVTASASVDFFNASANFSLDLSGSSAFSSLNQSNSTLGTSTGIAVTKPSFANGLSYEYPVTSYIFGQAQPSNVTDTLPLPPGTLQTFGGLQTAFVVDPLNQNAGGWWRQTYTGVPDIALNHPARWALSSIGSGPNCLSFGDPVTTQCAALAPYFPDDPWLSEYHWMRGFFISQASSGGNGPQLETATAGDKLLLQARVYNYSFTAMPAGVTAYARFYAQPWNSTNNTPATDPATGKPVNSFQIGQDVNIGAIPPFSDDDSSDPSQNWVFAGTTFDTTKYPDQDFTFWVIVWMQDSADQLSPELGGHGLSAVPGVLNSLADAPLQFQSPGVSYSNNVGFYKSVFHVMAPGDSVGAAPTLSPEFNIGKVQLSGRRTTPGQALYISAEVSTGVKPLYGTTAFFYDGDPNAGGQAFDAERAGYIRPNSIYQMKVPYRSDSCGVHELFVVLNKNSPNELVRRAPPVTIDCGGGLPQ